MITAWWIAWFALLAIDFAAFSRTAPSFRAALLLKLLAVLCGTGALWLAGVR